MESLQSRTAGDVKTVAIDVSSNGVKYESGQIARCCYIRRIKHRVLGKL